VAQLILNHHVAQLILHHHVVRLINPFFKKKYHCWLRFSFLSRQLFFLNLLIKHAGMGQQKHGLLFCPAIS
jgi:hypothetical protein